MAFLGRVISKTRFNDFIDGFYKTTRDIHTTSLKCLDQDWRRRHRLAENPNVFGPLTNLPDYSFADGRPTPFGTRMFARINKQREILNKVRKLAGEIDYAVARHTRVQKERETERLKKLQSKLKPKGQSWPKQSPKSVES